MIGTVSAFGLETAIVAPGVPVSLSAIPHYSPYALT